MTRTSREKGGSLSGPKTRRPYAARARDQVQDYGDPYTPREDYPSGTLCSSCGAIYENHWYFDAAKRDLLRAAGASTEVVCPGCRKIQERNPQGIVMLRGDYWPDHREEILNLVRNEEGRGMRINPLERIMDIREEEGALLIETTNEKLAQRIGRHVNSAHNGRVEYRWSEDNHLLRVFWERWTA